MAQPPKADKRITVTVSTLEGDYTHEYNIHQTVQHVVDKAVGELDLVVDGSWVLTYNGQPVTASATLEASGVKEGAVLMYMPAEGGGGHGSARSN